MRQRPPPMRHGKQLIESEFVIPIDGACFRFGLDHKWQPESDEVKVCLNCYAEWWTIPPEQTGEAA